MDLERIPDHPLAPPPAMVNADLANVAEPDAEVAVSYAAWLLDRTEDAR